MQVDPFSQLQKYLKYQKKIIRQNTIQKRQSISPNCSQRQLKTDNHIEFRNIKKTKSTRKTGLIGNDINQQKTIKRSPIRYKAQDQTQERIFPPNKVQQKLEKTKYNNKSYDFVANTENENQKRLTNFVHKRQNIIDHYQQHNDYWNKETVQVYKDLIKNVSPTQRKVPQSSKNIQIYEDPKLKRMKEMMQYHKEQLKRKKSNDVLLGGGETNERKSRRSISPLKYKYDFKSNIAMFESDRNKKDTQKEKDNNDQKQTIHEKDKDDQKQTQQPYWKQKSEKQILQKRKLVMTPSRKSLFDEFKKKFK